MKSKIHILWGLAIFSVLLNSCMSTTRLQVLKPAQISVPQTINNLALVNRSQPAKKKKLGAFAEGLITGEGIFVDKEGAQVALEAAKAVFIQSPRYEQGIGEVVNLPGLGGGRVGPALAFEQVDDFTTRTSADALVVLEAFDSDSRVWTTVVEERYKDGDGNKRVRNVFVAHKKMSVKTVWKIYDAEQKDVIDEREFVDFLEWSKRNAIEKNALASLPGNRKAVEDLGALAGRSYALRISPVWQWVNRAYYTTGHKDMKVAGKYVKKGEWDLASEIWREMEEKLQDVKIQGRASYNLALASEVKGDLELAIFWAKKAKNEYNVQSAALYLSTLQNRVNDVQRLQNQLKD